MSLVKVVAIAVAAVSQGAIHSLGETPILAQTLVESSEQFPLPDTLPDDIRLKVDGSPSMRAVNEILENRFEEQFPNSDIQLEASRTDAAFRALIAGDIDILATGRPLTTAEKAQGVIEVPLAEREKLAIIVGSENEFAGELTFDQFARIFRGEISNWSEVGGLDLPIRVVDRPDYSDTRRALSTYDIFEEGSFATGTTADPVTDDETDAVVAALGNDGIGYTVVSQAVGRDDVQIVPMHQTLPDDPRYPYSQYRAFVYKEGAGPGVLAFLGLATTTSGQEIVAADITEAATAAAPTEAPATGASTEAEATDAPAETSAAGAQDTSTATEEASPDPASAPVATANDAAAGTVSGRGFPLWILPLLAIPLLGALLWWLLKSGGGGTNAPAAETPGAMAGTAAAATVAAAPMAAVTATAPRIVLTPRDAHTAYAYWEVPQERLLAAKQQGGETMMLRLYDVTQRSQNAPLPVLAAEFPCLESSPDLHLPIALDDRSYCAEVGYLTTDNQWLPLAKSEPIRIRPEPGGVPVAAGAALAGAAVLGGAMAPQPDTQGLTQTFKIHGRDNAIPLDQDQRRHLEQNVAASHELIPGIYVLQLREGVFNYDADDEHPGEPFVLLWIHGGTILNQQTGIPISSTWTTLNGYEDRLVLDVREPTKLCAFFIDTYPDDNSGEVTLSITQP